MAPVAAMDLLAELARGVAVVHDSGLVHGDLKPDNVMIDPSGRPILVDFGLARRSVEEFVDTTGSSSSPRPALGSIVGELVGTPGYMAPELWHSKPLGAKSDQFALCATIFEAMTGSRPFSAEQLQRGALDDYRRRCADELALRGVSRAARQVIARGLASDPEARFASTRCLYEAIENLARRRRILWRQVGAACGGLAMMGALAGSATRLGGPSCETIAASQPQFWRDDRQSTLSKRFVERLGDQGAQTGHLVRAAVDAHVATLVMQRQELCRLEATQSVTWDVERERAQQCAQSIGRVVAELIGGDLRTLSNAMSVVATVSDHPDCGPRSTQPAAPEPEAPQLRAKVRELRKLARDIDLAIAAGRYDGAMADADALAVRAQDIGYPPLIAELSYYRGKVAQAGGQLSIGRQALETALELAVEWDYDVIASLAASHLLNLRGILSTESVDVAQIDNAARSHLLRAGSPPRLLVAWLRASGAAALRDATYGESIEKLQEAIRVESARTNPDHVELLLARNDLAVAYWNAGDKARAEAIYRQALAVGEASLGPAHTDLSFIVGNLGNSLENRGELVAAREYYQRAHEITVAALGSETSQNLWVCHRIVGLEHKLERFESALAWSDDCRRRQATGARSLDDSGTFRVRILYDMGRFDEARELHAEVVDYLRTVSGNIGYAMEKEYVAAAELALALGDDDVAEELLDYVRHHLETRFDADYDERLRAALVRVEIAVRRRLADPEQSGSSPREHWGRAKVLFEVARACPTSNPATWIQFALHRLDFVTAESATQRSSSIEARMRAMAELNWRRPAQRHMRLFDELMVTAGQQLESGRIAGVRTTLNSLRDNFDLHQHGARRVAWIKRATRAAEAAGVAGEISREGNASAIHRDLRAPWPATLSDLLERDCPRAKAVRPGSRRAAGCH